jgi:hypothetical protein
LMLFKRRSKINSYSCGTNSSLMVFFKSSQHLTKCLCGCFFHHSWA